jgi:hypothetical protein
LPHDLNEKMLCFLWDEDKDHHHLALPFVTVQKLSIDTPLTRKRESGDAKPKKAQT